MRKPFEQLSALDAAFLFFDQPGQRLVVGCIAELDGPADVDTLVARIEREIPALPRFRQRPERAPLDIERPTWEDDPDFSAARHVQRIAWPEPSDDHALRELSEELLSSPLDPSRPLWDATAIDGMNGGRSALFLRAHHCMLDGMSGAHLIERLSDPIAEGDREKASATPRTARFGERRGKARRASSDDTPFGAIDGWERMRDVAELISTSISLLHDDPAPHTPLNGRLSERRRIAWATFSLAELLALRGATRCTVNDLALAIVAGALRRYLWRERRSATRAALRALVPVSMRPREDAPSLGNAVSAMFPRLPVHLPDPLARLQWIATETRALKERGQPRATSLLLGALENLPSAVEALLPKLLPETFLFNTICTNVPGPRRPRRLAGRRILALHGVVPLFQGMGVQFGIMSHADRISICAHLDPSLIHDGDSLARDLVQSFAELRRAHDRLGKRRREPEPLAALSRPPSRYRSPEGASEPGRTADATPRARPRVRPAPS